jgi:hypothetical protein
MFGFRTAANNAIAACYLTPSGQIRVTSANGGPFEGVGTLFGETATPVVVANAWNHIEVKLFRSSTLGEINIRVNGIPVLTLDNLNLGALNTGIFFLGLSSFVAGINGSTAHYKDVVFWDSNGSQNNDFIGSVIVRRLNPESDVSLGGWVPSTGSTGFNMINSFNDSTFIQADDSPPALASFELENLPPDIVSVRALIPVTRSRKIDGGDGNLQTGLTGTLTDLGADRPLTTGFTYNWDVSELSPDTASPWTPLEVDAVKLDIDRTV